MVEAGEAVFMGSGVGNLVGFAGVRGVRDVKVRGLGGGMAGAVGEWLEWCMRLGRGKEGVALDEWLRERGEGRRGGECLGLEGAAVKGELGLGVRGEKGVPGLVGGMLMGIDT